MSDADAELGLKLELMTMDLHLKTKQAFWETPRNIAILLATFGTVIGVVAGAAGWKLGSQPPNPPQIIIIQPTPAPTTHL